MKNITKTLPLIPMLTPNPNFNHKSNPNLIKILSSPRNANPNPILSIGNLEILTAPKS
jgi:hypothetical protein